MTTVTDRRRANDRRSRDTKKSYLNMSQLDVALPRPSEARKGECPTTRGRAESLALSLLVVPSASKRSAGPRARSESRTESGLAAERLEVFRNDTQADTAYLGDETTLPRGLR